MNFLSQYITQILTALLLALFGFLGVQAKNLYKKYVTTEVKQRVCRTAVRFVEQVYRDIHGPEKLRAAMEKASELLANQGITITEDELIAMLEAAVNEFNNAFGWVESGRHLPETNTAGADPGSKTTEEIIGETVW